MPKHNLKKDAVYYAGSFLGLSLRLLHVLTYLLMVPVAIGFIQAIFFENPQTIINVVFICAAGIGLVNILYYIKISHQWDNQRRLIVEDGMLSIHSCSIVWHAVIVAHLRAHQATIKKTDALHGTSYRGYTCELGEEANEVAQFALDLHKYISKGLRKSNRLLLELPVKINNDKLIITDVSEDRSGARLLWQGSQPEYEIGEPLTLKIIKEGNGYNRITAKPVGFYESKKSIGLCLDPFSDDVWKVLSDAVHRFKEKQVFDNARNS